MKTSGWVCTGMTAGALMMYLFDPQLGRRRRALLRDQLVHCNRLLRERAAAGWSDTRHRAAGIRFGLLSLIAGDREVSDTVLESRVRTRLGRVVSHPGWLRVKADHGAVTVAGHVPEREKHRLLATVVSIRGVQKVEEDDLVIDPDDQVPETGIGASLGSRAPAGRLTAGLMGLAMGTYGVRRGGITGGVMALTGLGLILGGLIDAPLVELSTRLGRTQGE